MACTCCWREITGNDGCWLWDAAEFFYIFNTGFGNSLLLDYGIRGNRSLSLGTSELAVLGKQGTRISLQLEHAGEGAWVEVPLLYYGRYEARNGQERKLEVVEGITLLTLGAWCYADGKKESEQPDGSFSQSAAGKYEADFSNGSYFPGIVSV